MNIKLFVYIAFTFCFVNSKGFYTRILYIYHTNFGRRMVVILQRHRNRGLSPSWK